MILLSLLFFTNLIVPTVSRINGYSSDFARIINKNNVKNSLKEICYKEIPFVIEKFDQCITDKKLKNDVWIEYIPLSNKLNLNFVPLKLIKNSKLCTIVSKEIVDNLEKKIFLFRDEIVNIRTPAYDNFFSDYGIPGFNTMSLAKLEKFSELVKLPGELKNKLLDFKRSGGRFNSVMDFEKFCGVYFEDVKFKLGVDSTLNVNSTSAELLEIVLKFSGVKNADYKINKICLERNLNYINTERLEQILGVGKTHRVFDYIGTENYFYLIRVCSDSYVFFIVLAKIKRSSDDEYYIVQEGFEKCH